MGGPTHESFEEKERDAALRQQESVNRLLGQQDWRYRHT
jgi:hypothetical protein